MGNSSSLTGLAADTRAGFRRWARVQYNRTRRWWLVGLRQPQALPDDVLGESASRAGHQVSTVVARV